MHWLLRRIEILALHWLQLRASRTLRLDSAKAARNCLPFVRRGEARSLAALFLSPFHEVPQRRQEKFRRHGKSRCPTFPVKMRPRIETPYSDTIMSSSAQRITVAMGAVFGNRRATRASKSTRTWARS